MADQDQCSHLTALQAEVMRPSCKPRTRRKQDPHLLEAQLDAELNRQGHSGGRKKARRCSESELHKEIIGAVQACKRSQKKQSVKQKARMYEYDSSTGRLAPHTAQKSRSGSQRQQCASSTTKPWSNEDVIADVTEYCVEQSGRCALKPSTSESQYVYFNTFGSIQSRLGQRGPYVMALILRRQVC